MPSKIFTYLWEYKVKEEHIDAFEHQYGPDGDWVKLFKRSPDYIDTELHRDRDDPHRFVTLDYWVSKEARDKFKKLHDDAFATIDKRCEAFTETEKFIGDFECYCNKR